MNINIINKLKIIEDYERINNNIFKANAYKNAIDIIYLYPNKINSIIELNKVKGIGKNIYHKIIEYINTDNIKKINEIENDKKYILKRDLNKIYGIGPSKINELINKINNINELYLKENNNLLNNKQQIGLKYYIDLNKRIPYDEGVKHYNIIKKYINIFSKNIDFDMVGSYRRKNNDMGDIDILIKNNNNFNLNNFILLLKNNNYIIENLANGKKKYMGICKLNENSIARRIDILLCDENNYYFSLLYFTGSYKFNIIMRKKALEIGYSLSEYGFTDIKTNKIITNLNIKSEEDIFKIIGMKYVEPQNRV